jgi:two-component system, cell cycle response regulator DivK
MTLRLLGHIELPEHRSSGGFDHADIHSPTDRIYVAHTANDSIDVIDCGQDRYVESIPGFTAVAGALVSKARVLAPTEYEITEAENGEEALAAIAKQRPDLILMDIQLPIMDGYEATRRIKADASLRSIPIIAVSSYALNGEEKIARATGCDDYVPKPFSPRQLLSKIRQYLQ